MWAWLSSFLSYEIFPTTTPLSLIRYTELFFISSRHSLSASNGEYVFLPATLRSIDTSIGISLSETLWREMSRIKKLYPNGFPLLLLTRHKKHITAEPRPLPAS